MILKNTLNNSIRPQEDLSQRAIKSGWWLLISRITEQIFNFTRLIILARVLAPDDFGLMGVALLVMSVLETFSQTGFQTALIQKKNNTKSYLNTAWTVSILRGLILFVILYLAAPYAAIFFKAPQTKLIIQVIGLSLLLKGLTNIGPIYFHKELKFNKEFTYQFSGTFADFIVAVSAALIFKNAWALILGLLAGNLVRLIASYLVHPFRPRFSLEFTKMKRLLNFGKWVSGSTLLLFLAVQGDDFFLGKVLGVTALGFYQMAFRFANLTSSEIGLLSRITLPAYSKLQNNIPKLNRAYLKVLRFDAFFTLPFTGGLLVLAPEFTQIFLGDKWLNIIPLLQILVISSLIRELTGTAGALFDAQARPDINFKTALIRASILIITIYPLTLLWGIIGTAIAVLLSVCGCIPIWLWTTARLIKIKAKDYTKVFLPPMIATGAMSILIFILKTFLGPAKLISFLFLIFLGILTFLVCILLTQKQMNYPVLKDIKLILTCVLKPRS